jgi:iron(III) transport system substrate-binding protein
MSPSQPQPDPAPKSRRENWQRWLRDAFSAGGGVWAWGGLVLVLIGVLAGLLLPALAKLKRTLAAPEVVAYIAQDVVYAEPLLADFTAQTGIRVRTVFDSEAVKTVGLANRLLAERQRPQCDVFWGNEELRTRQLAAQGVWRETNGWAAFGYRSRRIMINTNFVAPPADEAERSTFNPELRTSTSDLRTSPSALRPSDFDLRTSNLALRPSPRSLDDLTNAVWRGKVALAYPLFGTTPTHLLALRQHWGANRWEAWCRALAANQPLIVDGNSVVARLVARGEAWVGLTDSDDILVVQRDGAPVHMLPLDAESLLIPNTVAVACGAPHPDAAQRLFEFLQGQQVVERLIRVDALEGLSPHAAGTPTLEPDWDQLIADLEPGTAQLKAIFVR